MITKAMKRKFNERALEMARDGVRQATFKEVADRVLPGLYESLPEHECAEYLRSIRRFLRETTEDDGTPRFPHVILVSERHWSGGNAEREQFTARQAQDSLPNGSWPAHGFYIARGNGDLIASHYCWQQTRMAMGMAGKAFGIEVFRGAPQQNLQHLAGIVDAVSVDLGERSGRRKPRKVREAATA